MRWIFASPQFGTHTLPNALTMFPQGLLNPASAASGLFVFRSIGRISDFDLPARYAASAAT
jgi:hypothetical protein